MSYVPNRLRLDLDTGMILHGDELPVRERRAEYRSEKKAFQRSRSAARKLKHRARTAHL